MTGRGGNRGIALILTLSIITLLVVTALELHRKVREGVLASAMYSDVFTLRQTATSGIHAGMALLVKDKEDGDIDSIQEEFKRVPGVLNAGLTSQVPGREASVSPFVPEGFSATEAQLMKNFAVDQEFIPTMGIEIVAG